MQTLVERVVDSMCIRHRSRLLVDRSKMENSGSRSDLRHTHARAVSLREWLLSEVARMQLWRARAFMETSTHLEELEIVVANAQHVKKVPGARRCERRNGSRLTLPRLLRSSFVPLSPSRTARLNALSSQAGGSQARSATVY